VYIIFSQHDLIGITTSGILCKPIRNSKFQTIGKSLKIKSIITRNVEKILFTNFSHFSLIIDKLELLENNRQTQIVRNNVGYILFCLIGAAQLINKLGGGQFDENDERLFEVTTVIILGISIFKVCI